MFAADAPTAGTAPNDVTKTVYSMDSITVQTNAFGEFDGVDVYSNKAGKVAVTVTSGAASQVVTLTFDPAAVTTGSALVVDAPAAVAPGSTLVVKATLKDKYGNTVDAAAAQKVTVSYNGPGLPLSTPTAFVDGALQFGVLLGSNDSGTATITVSVYDAVSPNPAKISVQSTITIGTVAPTVAAFTKRAGDKIQIVSQGSAKVRFELNGKRVASRQSLGTLNRTFDLVDGKNVIEIYVDGKRVLRRAATK
jgi:hypothetical protein